MAKDRYELRIQFPMDFEDFLEAVKQLSKKADTYELQTLTNALRFQAAQVRIKLPSEPD